MTKISWKIDLSKNFLENHPGTNDLKQVMGRECNGIESLILKATLNMAKTFKKFSILGTSVRTIVNGDFLKNVLELKECLQTK